MSFSVENVESFKSEIKKIQKDLQQLVTKDTTDELVKFENQHTLSELNECFSSSASEKELEENLKKFLANRWNRICNSTAAYTQQPLNEVNALCLELANILDPLPADPAAYDELEFGKGPYFLLMPSLKAHQTIFGENIHHLKLNEFVLSDNAELFIPIMACLERAIHSDTGEITHVVSEPDLYQFPKLTSSELVRIKEHSPEVKKYYQLTLEYNQKRLHDSNLGTELDKLGKSLRAGGAHAGGEELDSGAAANEGILRFTEFWRDYPEDKKKLAYTQYTDPSLEEAIGRLLRPADADYQDVMYCVELIESRFISPIVEQIQRAERGLITLKAQITDQAKVIEEAMKNPQHPVFISRKVKQPQVFGHIFALEKLQREEIFQHESSQSALLYALEHEPSALPQYITSLDENEQKQLTTAQFEDNDTALIIAAKAGAKDSVDLLLKAGAEIEASDINGSTALHWAAQRGHLDVVKLLIANNAEINATGAGKNTALHFAVSSGHADVVATLLDMGADITVKNRRRGAYLGLWGRRLESENALDLAIKHHPELIPLLLLKAITLPLDKQNTLLHSRYFNVLIYAAMQHPLLLDDLMAELRKQDESVISPLLSSRAGEGKTTLMTFAALGRIEAARGLLDLGADMEAVDANQNTALHEAANKGHANIIELLLEKGSAKKSALIESSNSQGNTPLHLAVSNGGRVVSVLLEQGANLNARNNEGKNALDIARKNSNSETMKLLLLQIIKLDPVEQKSCLSNIENGIYKNVLVYAMCEQPEYVDDLLIAMGKKDQYLAGYKEMTNFFDIDAHIDTFKEKLKEMEVKAIKNHRYDSAVSTAKVFIKDLMSAKADFLLNVDSEHLEGSKIQFKEQCLNAANEARPVLKRHREWDKLIGSFILVVLTLPVSLPLLALGVFSLNTNSVQKLDKFKTKVEGLDTSSLDDANESDLDSTNRAG